MKGQKVIIRKQTTKAIEAVADFVGKTSQTTHMRYMGVRCDDKALTLWASDSYRLAIYTESLRDDGEGESWEVAVEAKQLATAVKGVTLASAEVVEVDGARYLRIDVPNSGSRLVPVTIDRRTLRLDRAEGLVKDAADAPAGTCYVNSSYLASMMRAASKIYGSKTQVSLVTREARLIVMTAGYDGSKLTALVMPYMPPRQ